MFRSEGIEAPGLHGATNENTLTVFDRGATQQDGMHRQPNVT
jgi:hypothetical protein